MQLKDISKSPEEKPSQVDSKKIRTLINTALGREKADMVVANADLVNVYSGELLRRQSVAIKGDRIAYVGEKAEHTIGPDTRIIDAAGKVLVPGFIDAHSHLSIMCRADEFLKYSMPGGTTTIICETLELVTPLGLLGIRQSIKAIQNQPVKIFATVAPLFSLSPAAQSEVLHPMKLLKLLKQNGILGIGEIPWRFILQNEENVLRLYAEALNSNKCIVGHAAGARGDKLAAYVASGITSCHESTTAEEALERLRLGLHVMVREGGMRKDLEAISKIKDETIDFRRLVLCTDGVMPEHLLKYGHMEFVVQKAIDLGFDPIVAIQMATINAAEHYSLDNLLGGIAHGKYADMVILPDLRNIEAEMVISDGQIIARKGRLLAQPRKHTYTRSVFRSVHIPGKLKPADFEIHIQGGDKPVAVRVINQATALVTREEQMTMIPKTGLLKADLDRDILKVAFIDRTNNPGKMFTGFIKGFNLEKGAFATSATRGLSGVLVVGITDEDMAGAVNRVIALQGGSVVYARGEVLAELPLSIGGYISDLPIKEVKQRREEIQRIVTELGVSLPDAHLTLAGLTTNVIPFFRICESGLMDIKKGELVDLIVSCDRK